MQDLVGNELVRYDEKEDGTALLSIPLGYSSVSDDKTPHVAQMERVFGWQQTIMFHASQSAEGARILISCFCRGPSWESEQPYAGPTGSTHRRPNGSSITIKAIGGDRVLLSCSPPN